MGYLKPDIAGRATMVNEELTLDCALPTLARRFEAAIRGALTRRGLAGR
jgi:hypothetical protein